MLINDDFGFVRDALVRAEALLNGLEDDIEARATLRAIRIARSQIAENVSVEELEPFIGRRWVVVRQRRPGRVIRAVGCNGDERQILARELRDAERKAILARVPA